MLARIQQCIVATWLVLALALLWLGLTAGHHSALALAGLVLLCLGHATFLLLEFALARWQNRGDPAPLATPGMLLRAWLREAHVAPRVFAWQQPFRSRVLADNLPAPGGPARPATGQDAGAARGTARRGFVFIHGFVGNRGLWNPWLAQLGERGDVYCAVNLEPVLGSIDAYTPVIDAAVRRVQAATGLAPVLVCHSMGGLVARAWMAAVPGADARVHRTITIGSPHGGTWLARLSRTVNAHHMRPANDWLRGLAANEPAGRYEHFTCFFGHADNIVFPPRSATLPGADNRHLAATPHVAMAFHPAVMAEVLRWLPAQAPRA